MDRIERTELFGQHVISATAFRAAGADLGRWEIRASAVPIGGQPDAPLVRVAVAQQDHEDASGMLDAAFREARRILSGTAEKP